MVFAFLGFSEEIHAVRRGLETLANGSNGDPSQTRSRNAFLAMPQVETLRKRSNPRRENTHQSGIVHPFVQGLDGGKYPTSASASAFPSAAITLG
jgi:hypothetical protein